MLRLGGNFAFGNTRGRRRQCRRGACLGDPVGFADYGDFGGALDRAKPENEPIPVDQFGLAGVRERVPQLLWNCIAPCNRYPPRGKLTRPQRLESVGEFVDREIGIFLVRMRECINGANVAAMGRCPCQRLRLRPCRDERTTLERHHGQRGLEMRLVVEEVARVLLAESGPIVRVGDERIQPLCRHSFAQSASAVVELANRDCRTRCVDHLLGIWHVLLPMTRLRGCRDRDDVQPWAQLVQFDRPIR